MGGNEWDIEKSERGENMWGNKWEKEVKLSKQDYKELVVLKGKINDSNTDAKEVWKLIDREIEIIEKYAKDRYGEVDLSRKSILVETRWNR